jgi:hypothetical protein
VGLTGVVAWQAAKLSAADQQHQEQFQQLVATIQQLQKSTAQSTAAGTIPTVRWPLEQLTATNSPREPLRINDLVQAAQSPRRPTDLPWADWKPLEAISPNL